MSCVTFTTFLTWAVIVAEPIDGRCLRLADADGLPAGRKLR
jgi:hypothetical protein